VGFHNSEPLGKAKTERLGKHYFTARSGGFRFTLSAGPIGSGVGDAIPRQRFLCFPAAGRGPSDAVDGASERQSAGVWGRWSVIQCPPNLALRPENLALLPRNLALPPENLASLPP